MALTGELWELLQLLLPVFGDVDALLLGLLVDAVESLLPAVEDQLLGVLWVLGREDGEEVPTETWLIRLLRVLTLGYRSCLWGTRPGSVPPCQGA